jgi:hypothetical protein
VKRLLFVVLLLVLALPCMAFGQTPPPKPGPEVQQLAKWLGTWQCAYENKTGTREKGEWTYACEWGLGGFFLHCKGKTKTTDMTAVWGYNVEEKAYWTFRYFSNGGMDFSRGWVSGNTWSYVIENEHSGGKARRRQLKGTFESPTAWTYQWDRSVEGEPWVITQVGRCTKDK